MDTIAGRAQKSFGEGGKETLEAVSWSKNAFLGENDKVAAKCQEKSLFEGKKIPQKGLFLYILPF